MSYNNDRKRSLSPTALDRPNKSGYIAGFKNFIGLFTGSKDVQSHQHGQHNVIPPTTKINFNDHSTINYKDSYDDTRNEKRRRISIQQTNEFKGFIPRSSVDYSSQITSKYGNYLSKLQEEAEELNSNIERRATLIPDDIITNNDNEKFDSPIPDIVEINRQSQDRINSLGLTKQVVKKDNNDDNINNEAYDDNSDDEQDVEEQDAVIDATEDDEVNPIIIEHEFAPLYTDDEGNLVRPPFINLEPRERYQLLQLKRSIDAAKDLQSTLKYTIDPHETKSLITAKNKVETSTQTYDIHYLRNKLHYNDIIRKNQKSKIAKSNSGAIFSGEFLYDVDDEEKPSEQKDKKLLGYLGTISKPKFQDLNGDNKINKKRQFDDNDINISLDKDYVQKTEKLSDIIKVKEGNDSNGNLKSNIEPSTGFKFSINKEDMNNVINHRKEGKEADYNKKVELSGTIDTKSTNSEEKKGSVPFNFGTNNDKKHTPKFGIGIKEDDKPSVSFGTDEAKNDAPSFSLGKVDAKKDTPLFSFGKSDNKKEALGFSFGKPEEKKEAHSFSFGKTEEKKEAPSFSFGKPEEKKEAPSFSFGKTEEKKEAPSFSFGKPEEKKEAPSFSFGKTEEKKEAPSFSFGKPEEKKEAPSFSFGKPEEKKEAPGFSFGKPEEKKEAPSFSFGKPEEKNEAPSFSFGKPEEKKEAPSFSFGKPQEKKEAPSFSFGKPQEKKEAPSFSFGKPEEKKETPGFNFSKSNDKKELEIPKSNALFSNTEKPSLFSKESTVESEREESAAKRKPPAITSTQNNSTPTFSFGSTTKPTSAGTLNASINSTENKNDTKSPFNFGSTEKPTFNFGNSEKPSFNFGSTEKPSLGFNASTGNINASKSVPSMTSSFNFGQVDKPNFATTSPFNKSVSPGIGSGASNLGTNPGANNGGFAINNGITPVKPPAFGGFNKDPTPFNFSRSNTGTPEFNFQNQQGIPPGGQTLPFGMNNGGAGNAMNPGMNQPMGMNMAGTPTAMGNASPFGGPGMPVAGMPGTGTPGPSGTPGMNPMMNRPNRKIAQMRKRRGM